MKAALGVDIGGTSMKLGRVDLDAPADTVVSSVPTSRSARPDEILDHLAVAIDAVGAVGAVGIGFCGYVSRGVVVDANNLDDAWAGFELEQAVKDRFGLGTVVLNDADAAAVSEVPLCVERGRVLFITLGTGVGSAVIENGVVLPGLELGGAWVKDSIADRHASTKCVRDGDWATWSTRVDDVLEVLTDLVRPDHIILGGGASERWSDWGSAISPPVPTTPATFRNRAGVLGAALATVTDK